MTWWKLFFIVLWPICQAHSKALLCTHPATCALANQLLGETKFHLAFKMPGNPHHFHPSPGHIKTLGKASFLLVPPLPLQRWAHSLPPREGQKVFKAQLPATYKRKNPHAYAHFWLYPAVACQIQGQLETALRPSFKILTPASSCLDAHKGVGQPDKGLEKIISIIGHNAAVPLLKSLNIEAHSLEHSHHHSPLTPKSLKVFLKRRAHYKKAIWIQENQYSDHLGKFYRLYQKPGDILIRWNNLPDPHASWSAPLEELVAKIKKATQ